MPNTLGPMIPINLIKKTVKHLIAKGVLHKSESTFFFKQRDSFKYWKVTFAMSPADSIVSSVSQQTVCVRYRKSKTLLYIAHFFFAFAYNLKPNEAK